MVHEVDGGFSRRRLLRAGGVLAVGALAACGSNTGRGSSGESGGRPRLNQWYHQYGEPGTQQAVTRYAKAYDKADVTVSWKLGNYDQTTAAALLTDNGPDVFEFANGAGIDMIRGGQVADLTSLLGSARSDFNPTLLRRLTYQDKLYAIPQVVDVQLLVYRKSLLSKAGVTPPKTLEDLITAAGRLTRGKTKGLFLGNDGGAALLGPNLLWSVDLDLLTEDDAFGFDDPRAAKVFGMLRDLFTSGHLLLGAPKDWADPAALIGGLCAMQYTGLWTFPALQKALGDDFGCLPWPATSGGRPSVPMGAYASCVSTRSKDVEAAKQFVKWLWVDRTQDQLDFATAYGAHLPARRSLLAKADLFKKGPYADAAQYATRYGRVQAPVLWTPKCQTAFSDMLTRIVKDGADPMSEIRRLKPVVDAEVKRVKG